jgi:hypothetical protein
MSNPGQDVTTVVRERGERKALLKQIAGETPPLVEPPTT